MVKKSYAEIIVISVFLVPENMGIDTKMKFLRVSGNEIQVKIGIGSHDGHFGFMQKGMMKGFYAEMNVYQCILCP